MKTFQNESAIFLLSTFNINWLINFCFYYYKWTKIKTNTKRKSNDFFGQYELVRMNMWLFFQNIFVFEEKFTGKIDRNTDIASVSSLFDAFSSSLMRGFEWYTVFYKRFQEKCLPFVFLYCVKLKYISLLCFDSVQTENTKIKLKTVYHTGSRIKVFEDYFFFYCVFILTYSSVHTNGMERVYRI